MRRLRLLVVMVGLGLTLIALLIATPIARAREGVAAPLAQDGPGDGTPDDGKNSFDRRCLNCHAGSDDETSFKDGSSKPVHVDVEAFNQSVHGVGNPDGYLSCFDCHGEYDFPHEDAEYFSKRDFRLTLAESCESCHETEASGHTDSVHGSAMEDGNQFAPVCVDCHGYHDVMTPGEPRANASLTCGNCHTDIFDQYADSVHGEALLTESNPDVPTCVECHGVHSIDDASTVAFRLASPSLCEDCHANDELMMTYDISTDVFETYVADFHGTTVTLFEQDHPDEQVNKAVCVDCHGVHDIRSHDDPQSRVLQENLLHTCQECHPDADENFSATWMSHYVPSRENYPIVFYVNEFYKFFIPGVLLMMLAIIVPDAYHRLTHRGYEQVIDLDGGHTDEDEVVDEEEVAEDIAPVADDDNEYDEEEEA